MTNEATRREVIKFAAVLAVGAATADATLGQESSKPAGTADGGRRGDDFLARAKKNPEGYMLGEPEILVLDTDQHSRDLVITSACDNEGKPVEVHVRSRSVRIFRANPTVDEFTSQGGVYWRFRDKTGKVTLKRTPGLDLRSKRHSGPIVMVVRDEETVRLYTMSLDIRC